MGPRDLAARFLAKAAEDETLVDRVLNDADISDEAIGFHLQQSAEKLLKSVLVAKSIPFRRTHDLLELTTTLAGAGLVVPQNHIALDTLNPFAVEGRYEFLAPSSPGLDRLLVRKQIRALRSWAEGIIGL